MQTHSSILGDQIDLAALKSRLNLAEIATRLLGEPLGRQGQRNRLWWVCPFHDDRNPSFCVEPSRGRWKCWGCGVSGDAIDLVMRLENVTFREAVERLSGPIGTPIVGGRPSSSSRPMPRGTPEKAARRPVNGPTGLSATDATSLVEDAAGRILKPEGKAARDYLHGRGIEDETIVVARLGWTPGVRVPTRAGDRAYLARGIVIPWFDGDRLALVKIRQADGVKPRYAEAFRDKPRVFPSIEAIRTGMPAVVVEGEMDALLLGQELADLAAVVTLGSASVKLDEDVALAMLRAPSWYIATDSDDAGDKAATGWPGRAVRVQPPPPGKDWTDARKHGVDLRRWWSDRLSGIERPALFTWDELATWRWGPALRPSVDGDGCRTAERETAQLG